MYIARDSAARATRYALTTSSSVSDRIIDSDATSVVDETMTVLGKARGANVDIYICKLICGSSAASLAKFVGLYVPIGSW